VPKISFGRIIFVNDASVFGKNHLIRLIGPAEMEVLMVEFGNDGMVTSHALLEAGQSFMEPKSHPACTIVLSLWGRIRWFMKSKTAPLHR